MGYVCPVCEDPQADGEHLANHLAFTAMLGDDDHESWLDEHVPDWAETDPPELAGRVTDRAEETAFPQVFEDTTDDHSHDHDHDHGQSGGRDPLAGVDGVAPGDVSDPDALFGDDDGRPVDDVLAEARELTRQQWADAAAADGDESGDAAGESDPEADGDE